MENKLFYFVTFTIWATFVLAACSNSDNLTDNLEEFPEISEVTQDNTATIMELSHRIFDSEKVFNHSEYKPWYNDQYRSIFECFHSLDEIRNSNAASYIDELPTIDWDKQTLVIARVFCRQVLELNDCKVYCLSSKYTIDINFSHLILNALGEFSTAIILNKKDVQKKDIRLHLTKADN